MQVYETPIMSSEMHCLISSGVESLGFSSRNMFLGNSEGEMSSRSNVMATSYQGLGNTAVGNWKSLNVQEGRSNGVWAGPSIIIPSNIQGIVSYDGQNMVNSMLVAAARGGVSPSLDAKSNVEAAPQDVQTDAMQLYLMKPKYPNGYSEASSTASMMDVHPSSGLAPRPFESQKSFGEVRFNIPPVIQNAASEVSPSTQAVREPTHSQWQSAGSESDLPGKGNMQHNHLVLSHLNNTLNWSNRRTGSESWSRDPFLENKVPEYISAGQEGSGQGLQLSLSFHQPPDIHLQGLGNHANVLQMDEDSKPKAEDLFRCTGGLPYISSPYSRDGLTTGKGIMNSIQGRPSIMHMNGGSMQGPFASHATSLKNSAYLRATQELLYEFCNVGVGIKTNNSPKRKPSSMSGSFVPGGSSTRSTDFGAKSEHRMNQELFSGDRFELQRRKAKLLSMLEEVDRRYRHYCNQMQTIISSFESVTTVEAAGPYTALALKAMSRHFKCLRDAISSQVQLTSKCLGESDSVVPGTTRGETPRLGFLERSIRQQRALQQLGMMEQHPWRPQRGLPERSVSLLRAWLFEHFLHPYPTDADKHILARQTGLTRSQVSNWFINARVRLWKPMVEEMYMEETKEEQLNSSATADVRGGQNAEEKARTERSTGTNSDEKSAFKSGGSESQCTASEEAAAAFNSYSTASQTVQAESFGAVKLHHIPPSQHEMKNPQVALVGEPRESVSGMNVSERDMKLNDGSAYKNIEEEDKGFRSELYTNKLQAPHETEMALDLSSYNITPASTMAAYSYDELNPRHFANSGVSLTLGLHHSGGLSFPLTEEKYDNNIYFSRDDSANQYTMLDNAVSQDNGYLEQDLPYRNYGNGNRLLHDFVG